MILSLLGIACVHCLCSTCSVRVLRSGVITEVCDEACRSAQLFPSPTHLNRPTTLQAYRWVSANLGGSAAIIQVPPTLGVGNAQVAERMLDEWEDATYPLSDRHNAYLQLRTDVARAAACMVAAVRARHDRRRGAAPMSLPRGVRTQAVVTIVTIGTGGDLPTLQPPKEGTPRIIAMLRVSTSDNTSRSSSGWSSWLRWHRWRALPPTIAQQPHSPSSAPRFASA